MHIRFKTTGVCSSYIDIDVVNGIVEKVEFIGGCQGNARGIASLIKGMKIEDVIVKLEGIKCGYKNTSCPDQLSRALKEMKNGNN